MKVKNKVLPEP